VGNRWRSQNAIAIHTSDPEAFFLPVDRFNERYDELQNHPDWSFHGRDFPSNMELQEGQAAGHAPSSQNSVRLSPRADSENLALCPSAWMRIRYARGYRGQNLRTGTSALRGTEFSTAIKTASCSRPMATV